MARRRIRSIKPEFFGDEKVLALTRDGRYTMIGLISLADDRGRLRDRPLEMLGAIYPEEKVTTPQLRKWTGAIMKVGLALRYEVDGHFYLWLPRFLRHQVVEKPTESELPAHPDDQLAELEIGEAYKQAKSRTQSRKDRGNLPDKSGRSRGDVGEASILSRASFPVLPSSTPISPRTDVAGASDLVARLNQACEVIGAARDWPVEPDGVANVEAMYPAIDIVQAARLGATWASDSSWDVNSAAATLRAAAKKLDEERLAGEGKAASRRESPSELLQAMGAGS